ncbi:Hypothetical predicted protein [Olea europaea subsp. europaea]|uniref:Uncharacterized protein n=1 Tax=Olea europaea subsp. europaea TaxID=158383 RepID=A0A8S0U587_OLEEU|nr:Hypothetical predicted protein [Olea europaea subsp. europaea]
MLLAVEGGGFFSSSASGYSKGLTLLLLGQRKEEKPMRVTPWNRYQLVEQEIDPDFQLATGKNWPVHGCASFVCFGRATGGVESPSHLKVGPTQHEEVSQGCPVDDEGKDQAHLADHLDTSNRGSISLKSSMKKPTNSFPVSAASGSSFGNGQETLCEKNNDVTSQMERRKVQWTDTSGGELFETREFEMSEVESDEEFDHRNQKTCACRIM